MLFNKFILFSFCIATKAKHLNISIFMMEHLLTCIIFFMETPNTLRIKSKSLILLSLIDTKFLDSVLTMQTFYEKLIIFIDDFNNLM